MNLVNTIYDDLSYAVIGAAMEVHSELGPGFPEKVYHEALMIALAEREVPAEKQVTCMVDFHGRPVGEFRLDILVDEALVVELKALDELTSKHQQQVISYLTVTGREAGLLLNLGTERLQKKRIFPPRRVQDSQPYKRRRDAWKSGWLRQRKQEQGQK
ncbi:MAG: GxxExxY protein [Chloroflexota bacterium]|nr:GxxExxY protein [Chloroflexota bacterium]